jgi:hypothetical protein
MNSEEDQLRMALQEIEDLIRNQITQAHRPADEVIIDDFDLRNILKVSKRSTASLREKGLITYYKPSGKILYKLSDVLDMLDRHEIKAIYPIVKLS